MDTSKLSNFGDLYSVLTKINTANLDGKQWFAPIDWGNTGVLYRTDSQIAAVIADLERQIASMTTTPVTSILVAASKGLDT